MKALFTRKLDSWNNPGLMITKARRAEMASQFPWAAEVIDWPELRQAFEKHDKAANRLRWFVRWQGRISIIFAVLGLILTASTPVVAAHVPSLTKTIGVIASFLILIGGGLGFEHLTRGSLKSRWLIERFWTERLRQLYFQSVLDGVEDLASGDAARIERWKQSRTEKLRHFVESVSAAPSQAVQDVEMDLRDERAWIFSDASSVSDPDPENSERLSELLDFLGVQRVDDQYNYIRDKIDPGLFSPHSNATFFDRAAMLFALLTIVTAVIVAGLNVFADNVDAQFLTYALALQACLSAAFAGARVFDEGLGYSKEKELYDWYSASVAKLKEGYGEADRSQKLQMLFSLEQLTYEEFRRFLITHENSNFLL